MNIGKILKLLFLVIILSCRNEKENLPDFTFIKIGYAENKELWHDSLNVGSSFYLKTLFEEDSLLIKVTVISDELDSIKSDVYKIALPDSIKENFKKFKDFSDKLSNGSLSKTNTDEPIFYSGGHFILYYSDEINNEKYFDYIKIGIEQEVRNFHNLIISFAYENLPSPINKRNLDINTDSITLLLCNKLNIHIPSLNAPFKFQPPRIK